MFPLSSWARALGRAVGAAVSFVQQVFPTRENPTPEQAFYDTARDAALLLPAPAPFRIPAQALFLGRLAQRLFALSHSQKTPGGSLQRGVECFLETARPDAGILLQPIALRHSLEACTADSDR